MPVSSCPREVKMIVVLTVVVAILLAQVEGRKLPENTNLTKQKTKVQRCSESKDGNCKTSRNNQTSSHSKKPNTQVTHYSPPLPLSPFRTLFSNHFMNGFNFAEKMALNLAREMLIQYKGWERDGKEMRNLNTVVETITEDLGLIIQLLKK